MWLESNVRVLGQARGLADLRDRSKWNQYLDWLETMTVKFPQAFSPRVKEMTFEVKSQPDEEAI